MQKRKSHGSAQSGLAYCRIIPLAVGLVCSVFLICSCRGKSNALPEWLQNVNLTNLVVNARSLTTTAQKQGEWYWSGNSSNLPPVIRTLGAQKIIMRTNPPPLRLEVSMSSGFLHHGLIIICETNDVSAPPAMGRNWPVRKIADFIYEYKE